MIHSVDYRLRKIHSLRDSGDLTEWEEDFVRNVWEQTDEAKDTTKLTEKQLNIIDNIYFKNFEKRD